MLRLMLIYCMVLMLPAISVCAHEGFFQQGTGEIRTEKITSGQIHLTKDGIFVYMDHHFYPVHTIHSIGGGDYLCDFLWEPHFNPPEPTCGICGSRLEHEGAVCSRCGYGGA